MDAFIGEIRMFGGNFNPSKWLLCDGQIVNVSEYQSLYSLIGNTYGGTFPDTFAVPDLRGRVPVSDGRGPGMMPYSVGQPGGLEKVALNEYSLPQHTHQVACEEADADSFSPAGKVAAKDMLKPAYYTGNSPVPVAMNSAAVSGTGGGMPHNNMQPFQVVNYIICAIGVYPQRS